MDTGTFGTPATDVTELVKHCIVINCPLDADDAGDGRKGGYLLFWHADTEAMEAWPALPGLTGNLTVLANGSPEPGDRTIQIQGKDISLPGTGSTAVPTPGADEALAAAWDTIGTRAAELIGGLFASDPKAALEYQQMRFANDVLTGYRTALNPDADESVSLSEVLGTQVADKTLDTALYAFASTVIKALAIGEGIEGPGFESWSSIVVSDALLGAAAVDASAITYKDTASWTALFVERRKPERVLIGILEKAELAARKGDEQGESEQLLEYSEYLDAGVFSWVTRNHAEALKAILPAIEPD